MSNIEELTEDYILNGNISLLQPKHGYRVAIDPIIFSHFIETSDNQSVLDVGCGVGTISLILKHRNSSAKITAIDIDNAMCKICEENSRKNFLEIDIRNIEIENIQNDHHLKNLLFDHVVTNPPFFDQKSYRISSNKLLSNFETIELSTWISFCLKKVKNKGTFSIIHKASMIDYILRNLGKSVGAIEVIPIFSKYESFANRVIVKCVKGKKTATKIHPGLVIHNEAGKYTEKISKILKNE
jgi:tRNA1(Val) A37 N6-methylase TrmN6